ncbi:MAG: endonuclease III [bacterium]|nr:endonuclease III [bacterium]
MNEVLNYLNELFPNPKCELNYCKDYELLIAVMLSAQTTDKMVNQVTKKLFDKYKNLESLSQANIEDIKKIIKSIGSYNKKSVYIKEISKILINKYDGKVPNNHNDLESMPGVGHKSANVVLGVLYNIPTFAVDTHVTRVAKRLGFVDEIDNVINIERKMKKIIPENIQVKTHHQLVLFGRYYCKALKPKCEICKLKKICKNFK